MTEHDIGKMITCTIDSMPVPWEKLWTVFRKILQLTQRENENNIIQKEENSEVETCKFLQELWKSYQKQYDMAGSAGEGK